MEPEKKPTENNPQYQKLQQAETQPFYDSKPIYSESNKPTLKPKSIFPQHFYCEVCQKQIISDVKFKAGIGTYLCSFVICICGGIFGCCLIPCCINDCQDAKHYCPICEKFIGRKQFLIHTDN